MKSARMNQENSNVLKSKKEMSKNKKRQDIYNNVTMGLAGLNPTLKTNRVDLNAKTICQSFHKHSKKLKQINKILQDLINNEPKN
ncbi:CLUMA_CG021500, isoform A [Clunio marinus]|uniref:CLUMA_CG021500, isoform A n=1 Tax=Clunio marinus TaxID=568069 RepID=A0A1J1J9U2_9DIPT|nr:CLUMA_CG021500, isoform A [Clunio marinus]